MSWDDPRLEVPSDTELRRTYRRHQSWYREQRLNARFAPRGPSGRAEPVGSLLHGDDVRADRALNFLGDPEILEFVERRARQVASEGGNAEAGRLFHNMLSSMPMAFSTAAVLSSAPDRAALLSQLFGVDAVDVGYVSAEWRPRDAARRIGGTAFDIAVRYRDARGAQCVLGVEVKYTESPSEQRWVDEEWLTFSEDCGWFLRGAGDLLARGSANQLWRNVLLAAKQETEDLCDVAVAAVVGLARDDTLWSIAEEVRSALIRDRRQNLVTVTWEDLVDGLAGSSLTSFAGLFTERYLDLGPSSEGGGPPILRRSVIASEDQRRRRFVRTPPPTPTPDAMADQAEWGRWLPSTWRTQGDPSAAVVMPPRPPAGLFEVTAWWTPALHLMLFGLGWPSPATGLTRWDRSGRPLDDPELQFIEAVYGRHLEALLSYLWHGHAPFEDVAGSLGLPPVQRPAPPAAITRTPSAAVTAGHNPVLGGTDPLHLSRHTFGPLADSPGGVEVHLGDTTVGGPPRATLVCRTASGWYRSLHQLDGSLPGGTADGWRVDVVVAPVGHLGTFRKSSESGRWFTGQHRWHQLGIPSGQPPLS